QLGSTSPPVSPNTSIQASSPVTVSAEGDTLEFSQVAAGETHACGIEDESGALLCWGNNLSYQLGTGDRSSSAQPRSVQISVAGGEPIFFQVVAGKNHTCALSVNPSPNPGVYCWGDNSYGQLGTGSAGGADTNPRQPTLIPNLTSVQSLYAGGDHTCAILNSGKAKCWGRNDWGQLGKGREIDQSDHPYIASPSLISTVSGGIESLGLGPLHTCALLSDSSVWCWGNNSFGQLGDGTSTSRVTAAPVLYY
ncbi:MAG: RCC1 domain-containing protein, partial [Bdellovibrionia bacterium]